MKSDSDFLMEYTKEKFEDVLKESTESRITLDTNKIKDLHPSIKTRAIRYAIENLNSNLKGVERKHIEDILELISSNKTGKMINITNNIVVKISYDDLILEKNEQSEELSFNHKLEIGYTKYIEELGSKIKSSVYSIEDVNIDFNNNLVKCFDYDNINSEIYVRNRKNGDKFKPLGMTGNKKLKSFFIDEKIPKEQRSKIPLVLDGETIIWVVGFRISEDYKVGPSTKKVLVLEYMNI